MSNLYQAHYQWANRPDDERFETVRDMYEACRSYAATARTTTLPFDLLRVEADEGELFLVGKTDRRAKFTHYAFGQLARSAQSPAEFVRQLPATLASQVINNRLKAASERSPDRYDSRILFHENGSLVTRAITSELYDRTWNHEVIKIGILPMLEEGWRVPPARPALRDQKGTRKATEADILPNQGEFGLSVNVGDEIAPAGLYASDHDMFAFLVNPERTIDIGKRALMRGMFVRNSEVGDGSLVIDWFDLDNVCGNHIVWGAENRKQIRVRHVAGKDRRDQGDTLKRALAKYEVECRVYENQAKSREEQIRKAQKYEIAATKEDTIEAIFTFARKRGLTALSRKTIEAGYEKAEEHSDWYGSPRTVFGLVSGLTEHSQTIPYTDERHNIDVQAGRVMEIAF